MNESSVVYFVQGVEGGLIKIGYTQNLTSRLGGLQCGSPIELRVLATESGHKERESELHLRFAHLRQRGEWFEPDTDLVAYVKSLAYEDAFHRSILGRAKRVPERLRPEFEDWADYTGYPDYDPVRVVDFWLVAEDVHECAKACYEPTRDLLWTTVDKWRNGKLKFPMPGNPKRPSWEKVCRLRDYLRRMQEEISKPADIPNRAKKPGIHTPRQAAPTENPYSRESEPQKATTLYRDTRKPL